MGLQSSSALRSVGACEDNAARRIGVAIAPNEHCMRVCVLTCARGGVRYAGSLAAYGLCRAS
eukprot:2399916-Prymnesium_polylepis.1